MSNQKLNHPSAEMNIPKVDAARRRLTTVALTGPVVLSTFASRKVLAGNSQGPAYHCTVSGKVSGTHSPRVGEGISCSLGVSPGCWKSPHVSCKDKVKVTTKSCEFTGKDNDTCDGKKQYKEVSKDEFVWQDTTGCRHRYPSPYFPDYLFRNAFGAEPDGCTKANVTLFEVLLTGGGNDAPCNNQFARAAVASLLNAAKWYDPTSSYSFPLTVRQVVGLYQIGAGVAGAPLFKDLFPGVPAGTTPWTKAEILEYFQSLYGGNENNSCPAGKLV